MSKPGLLRTFVPAIIFSLCMVHNAEAAKTDVVVLINGDSVTGEVKNLRFGVLRYSTDSMGTVEIAWEDIVSLTSKQSMQVEVSSGTRYFGELAQPEMPGAIRVGRGENWQDLAKQDVVRMTPIDTDERLVDRIDASVSFGFDTDKGSRVSKGNFAADLTYRTRQYQLGANLSSSITDQPGAETTRRQQAALNYQRFRSNRWFTGWLASIEQNDEQGIDRRLSGGGAVGRYLVQNNSNQLSLLGGLVATREDFTGDDPSVTNLEGLIGLGFLHRVHEPEAYIKFSAEIYPLLEDLSSFRAKSDLSYRKEFIEDLFFDLSVYYTYISQPAQGAEKDDYGVVTSLGYSF